MEVATAHAREGNHDDEHDTVSLHATLNRTLQEKQDKAGVSAGPQRIPALVVGVPGAEPPVGRIDVWGTPTPFQYDIAFPMNANQLDVFEHVGVDIVKCAYHGCEFSCDRSFLSQITDHSPN